MVEVLEPPVDVLDEELVAAQQREREQLARDRQYADLAELISTPGGRRTFRRILRTGHLDPHQDHVGPITHVEHALQSYQEALRTEALRTLWPLLRLVASGRLTPENFCLVFTEQEP